MSHAPLSVHRKKVGGLARGQPSSASGGRSIAVWRPLLQVKAALLVAAFLALLVISSGLALALQSGRAVVAVTRELVEPWTGGANGQGSAGTEEFKTKYAEAQDGTLLTPRAPLPAGSSDHVGHDGRVPADPASTVEPPRARHTSSSCTRRTQNHYPPHIDTEAMLVGGCQRGMPIVKETVIS